MIITKKKTANVKIKAPFYGAGSKYGWVKDGYDIFGFGLKLTDLKNFQTLTIQSDGNTYTIDTEKAIYKRFYQALQQPIYH